MIDAVLYVAVCLFGFGLIQRGLATTLITAPILFEALRTRYPAKSQAFGPTEAAR